MGAFGERRPRAPIAEQPFSRGERTTPASDRVFPGIEPVGDLADRLPDDKLLRRDIVFGHRDLDVLPDARDRGDEFAVMTGLMPSGPFHFGHKTVEEDVVFELLAFHLIEDDDELESVRRAYAAGDLLSGEIKEVAKERLAAFFEIHQRNRAAVVDRVERFVDAHFSGVKI